MAGSSRELRDRYSRMSMVALVVGVIGIVGLIAGWILDTDDFYQSYIFGYAYWMTITLGMIAWGLLHNMTAGKWGFTIRRMLQAGSFNDSFLLSPIVLMAVMFLIGFLPPVIILRGKLWQVKRRLQNAERALAAGSAAPEPKVEPAPVAVPGHAAAAP